MSDAVSWKDKARCRCNPGLPAEAHEEYLHSLLRKTLLEDPEKVSPSHSKTAPLPSVQLELRSLVQQTLELRPRIRSLSDTVHCTSAWHGSQA